MMRCFDNQLKSIEASRRVYRKKKMKFARYIKTLKSRVNYLEGVLKKIGATFDREGKVVINAGEDNHALQSLDEVPSTSLNNSHRQGQLRVEEMEGVPSNTANFNGIACDGIEESLSQIFPRVTIENISSPIKIRPQVQTMPTINLRPEVANLRWEDDEEILSETTALAVKEVFPSPSKRSAGPDNNGVQDVQFVSLDGCMQVYIKSVTKMKGEQRIYGLGIWFTKDNPLNQEAILLTPTNESQTCRIELDVNAVILALATAQELGVRKVVIHTESKYVPRITLGWLNTNKTSSWEKVKNIFKNLKCLDTLLSLLQLFEDVKYIQVSANGPEMIEISRNLHKKISEH